MAILNLKQKVPKKYSYPLTIKEIKELAKNHVEIDSISYAGISPHDQIKKSKNIWLGVLRGSKVNSSWQYQLAIYASRNSLLDQASANIKTLMITEVQKWLEWNSIHLAMPITFNRLYLSAENVEKKLLSTSTEHTNTGFIIKK